MFNKDTLTSEQEQEIVRCAADFPYFCQNYVQVLGHLGLVPFKLHPFQERLYNHFEDNRFSILSKFRCGGFTTEAVIYGMWKCLFRLDQSVMYLARTDREAICGGEIVKRALDGLPDWLKGTTMQRNNDHQKHFDDTGSKMFFGCPEAACGRSMSLLIVDEASWIKDMLKHWKAMYPTLSCGGNCIIQSTVNSTSDWFWGTLEDARAKLNQFAVFENDYREYPEYNNANWTIQTKNNLGPKGWQSEVLQQALDPQKPDAATPRKPKARHRSIFDAWSESSE